MRVFHTLRQTFCLLGLVTLAFASAQAQTNSCADIANDVASAIQKDPSKTLMIVEDALVINETCACEIIKAAIVASKADATLVNQIVQTGISVAPKMSGIIMDCATTASPGTSITSQQQEMTVVDSGKNPVKNPLPTPVAPVEEDFTPVPSSIRGIYLIQPPASGFVRCDPKNRKCNNVPTSPCNCTPNYN